MNAINKSAVNADFIVGHNPAAFWPAYTLAKKRKVPFAIDIEDYHPGEFDKGHKKRIMEELMSKVLPSAKYVSFASNLILQETLQKIPAIRKGIVIDNCFERGEFLPIQKEADNGKLQLVWFSQNINYLRGLELVLPVLAKFKEQLTVTLVGNLNAEFAKWLEPYSSFTKVISPLAQVDLHHLLRNFDVGLAIEDPKANMNRDICLTNKIWSYFQSGLFILASTTKAQKEFLHQHNPHGKLFDLNAIDSLDQAIEYLIKNKDDIRHQKGKRYNRALRYSWENEADKLIAEWREVVVG
jgi:glycosyltransferase involved in cell wall biosynthesis